MSIKTKWNLKLLFKSDNDPKIAQQRQLAERQVKSLIQKWSKRSDYLTKPKVLADLLQEYEQWQDKVGAYTNEWYYFYLRNLLHQTDDQIKARMTQAIQASQKLFNQVRFIFHNIQKIEPKLQAKFLSDPKLKDYRTFLKLQFALGKYQLSLETENVLALKEQPANDEWVDLTRRQLYQETAMLVDDSGKKQERPFAGLDDLFSSKKKTVRQQAAAFVDRTVIKHADVATAELNAILLNKQIDDELRGFKRPDQKRILSSDLTEQVLDMLVKTVTHHNNIAKDFYAFKAKLMKAKQIEYYDRAFNPFDAPQVKFSFGQAVDITRQALLSLDPTFAKIFDGLLANGQIDALPQKGKYGNACCVYGLRQGPIYILVNHTSSVRDVMTLAHEVGHAINFTLSQEQTPINYEMSLAVAETASTFFEQYAAAEILRRNPTKELKRYLLFEKINDQVSTIFRQIALYRFEQELHQTFRQRGRLSQTEIGQIFAKKNE